MKPLSLQEPVCHDQQVIAFGLDGEQYGEAIFVRIITRTIVRGGSPRENRVSYNFEIPPLDTMEGVSRVHFTVGEGEPVNYLICGVLGMGEVWNEQQAENK